MTSRAAHASPLFAAGAAAFAVGLFRRAGAPHRLNRRDLADLLTQELLQSTATTPCWPLRRRGVHRRRSAPRPRKCFKPSSSRNAHIAAHHGAWANRRLNPTHRAGRADRGAGTGRELESFAPRLYAAFFRISTTATGEQVRHPQRRSPPRGMARLDRSDDPFPDAIDPWRRPWRN